MKVKSLLKCWKKLSTYEEKAMLSKLKIIFKYLRPYKISDVEKEFIDLNSKYWSSSQISKGYSLVEGHLTDPASVIDKARIAKAIEEETGCKPVVFMRGFYPEANDVYKVYASFGIEEYYMWWKGFLNPKVCFPAIYKTLQLINSIECGEQLLTYRVEDILIGDLIYDTLVRYKPQSYTVNSINFSHYRLIFRAFLTFYNNKKMLVKYQPTYLVTSHNVYAEFGMLPRQLKALNNGIVFVKDIYAYKCYNKNTSIREHFLKPSKIDFTKKMNSENFLNEARQYFLSRMKGDIDQIDVKNAFLNKKRYDIKALKNIYSLINENRQNVIVMSHAFSDAPHVGEGLLFKDYYDFLEKTLIKLNDNTEINCFVKPHPSSYMWNERGAVEELVRKNNLKNVYIIPNDLDTSSMLNFADCIVTAKGTAGLEFSCFGIPAVTAGKGYYHGFDIAYEPQTLDEYYQLLNNIQLLPRLNQEKIDRALVLLYMVALSRKHSPILPKSHILPGEDHNEVYLSKYSEVVRNFKKNIPIRDDFYEEVKRDVVVNDV